MPQRTGIVPPPGPPKKVAAPQPNPDADGWQVEAPGGPVLNPQEEDLGLRPVEPFTADPTGFVPGSRQVVEVAGRAGIPLSGKDLEELHYSHAGAKPMVNDPGSLLDRKFNLTEEESAARAEEIARKREYEAQRKREEGDKQAQSRRLEDELLQNYQVNDQPTTPPRTTGPAVSAPEYFEGSADTTSTPSSVSQSATDVGEAGKLLESLVAKAGDARARGDIKLATELNGMIQQILVASNLRRSQPKKERHPALQKLLSNLGLERIKPVDIEWLGTLWRFAPRPEPLDWWVAEHMGENGIELNHAIVAATLIGMDRSPLYDVFNIPLSAEYTIIRAPTNDDPGGESRVSVPAYTKLCESCGIEVTLDAKECRTCGSLLDPFDVPIDLRFRYADMTKRLLMEKLCLNTDQIGQLVILMKNEMKDRRLDQEEVFPLTRLLPKPTRTTG